MYKSSRLIVAINMDSTTSGRAFTHTQQAILRRLKMQDGKMRDEMSWLEKRHD